MGETLQKKFNFGVTIVTLIVILIQSFSVRCIRPTSIINTRVVCPSVRITSPFVRPIGPFVFPSVRLYYRSICPSQTGPSNLSFRPVGPSVASYRSGVSSSVRPAYLKDHDAEHDDEADSDHDGEGQEVGVDVEHGVLRDPHNKPLKPGFLFLNNSP